jgi:hypothetical protein
MARLREPFIEHLFAPATNILPQSVMFLFVIFGAAFIDFYGSFASLLLNTFLLRLQIFSLSLWLVCETFIEHLFAPATNILPQFMARLREPFIEHLFAPATNILPQSVMFFHVKKLKSSD